MQLSESFAIDPREPWVVEHNREVREVMEAFQAGRPTRVPLITGEWAGQHGFYAEEVDLDYRKYYTDPDEMVRVQLEAAKRRREIPFSDIILGEAPERWPIAADFVPVIGPGWFGCPLEYRKDAVIAHRELYLSKEECLALEIPDPVDGGFMATQHRFYDYLKDTYEGKLTFLGKPVGPVSHGVVTSGFFSLALDLRGAEIMSDMYEDPEFAHAFLEKLASALEMLERTWCERTGQPVPPFYISDHGIDMLSAEMYEEFIAPLSLEMNRRRGTEPPQNLHHCGRGSHLFPTIKRIFGLNSINVLTYPLNDIAKVRHDLGEDVTIYAVIDDGIIQLGPPERIRQVVKEFFDTVVKGNGGLALMLGDLLRGTPMENRIAYYEAVKEYGQY
ncbi:MAG: uroporphyrinogen decarboxylase family protein [Armatimonadota bacterium]